MAYKMIAYDEAEYTALVKLTDLINVNEGAKLKPKQVLYMAVNELRHIYNDKISASSGRQSNGNKGDKDDGGLQKTLHEA